MSAHKYLCLSSPQLSAEVCLEMQSWRTAAAVSAHKYLCLSSPQLSAEVCLEMQSWRTAATVSVHKYLCLPSPQRLAQLGLEMQSWCTAAKGGSTSTCAFQNPRFRARCAWKCKVGVLPQSCECLQVPVPANSEGLLWSACQTSFNSFTLIPALVHLLGVSQSLLQVLGAVGETRVAQARSAPASCLHFSSRAPPASF